MSFLEKAAFHDKESGCGATSQTLDQSILSMEGKTTYASGESGTVSFVYDVNSYSCGRVQIDGAFRNANGNREGLVFFAEVIDYGVDCPDEEPVEDMCPNIDGVQERVPNAYQLVNGQCVPDAEVDACPNIVGNQPTVPSGHHLENGQCVPDTTNPVDVCPNLEGNQSSIPAGYELTGGQCVPISTPPTDVCSNIEGIQSSVPSGYQVDNGICTPIVTPPLNNSCPLPDSLGDTTSENPNPNPNDEPNLLSVINSNGYPLEIVKDQRQYQVWNVENNKQVTINTKFIAEVSDRESVFGYYKNGNLGTFVPIFKTSNITGYDSTPLASSGNFTISTGSATNIGFALKSYENNQEVGVISTQNSTNSNSLDQVMAFNPEANKYLLAFEDLLSGSDFDYQDLVVEITLNCGNIDGGNNNLAPIADAGPDQTITLPTNSVNLDASGSTDPDGTIVSYGWAFVSGPTTFDPSDVISPTISDLVEGTYVLRLIVTDDDGATDDDTVTITVKREGGGGNDKPECSDDVDNNDPEDTLIDEADPGCHTDGDPNNPETYDPNDDNETNNGGGGNDKPECSDDVDNNDPEDTLVDEADPGCHSDGDPNNNESYTPNDDDETDDDDDDDNGGGGGSSGSRRRSSGSRPQGEVLGAETSCGIYVDKYMRIGYRNNVEAVKKLQVFLNNYMNQKLVVDGIYGPETEMSVRRFQVWRSGNVLVPWNIIESTGIFYLTTQTEVNNIMCPPLELPIPSPLINWSQNHMVELPPIGQVNLGVGI